MRPWKLLNTFRSPPASFAYSSSVNRPEARCALRASWMLFRRFTLPPKGPLPPAVASRAAAILRSSIAATSPAFICQRRLLAQVLRVEGSVRPGPSSQTGRSPVWSRPRRWLARAGAAVIWFLVRASRSRVRFSCCFTTQQHSPGLVILSHSFVARLIVAWTLGHD